MTGYDRKPRSAMTIRIYRVTTTGRRLELTRSAVVIHDRPLYPISGNWPECACSRCEPAPSDDVRTTA